LFHQFRFRLLLQLGQEFLDPGPDILGEFLIGDYRRRWVGNRLDRDAKKVPCARPQVDPASGATRGRKVNKLIGPSSHGQSKILLLFLIPRILLRGAEVSRILRQEEPHAHGLIRPGDAG